MNTEARLSFQDLDRDELLALLGRRLIVCSQADLLWAKWEIASDRHLQACRDHSAAFGAEGQALLAYRAKPNSKTLAAWETAENKERRLYRRSERLRRLADDLYAQHSKAMEARS